MSTESTGRHHDPFRRLATDRVLTDLDRKLVDAYHRLSTGESATTDGSITVTNLCTEAGVSRASYYRSPVSAVVTDLLATAQAPRSEIATLRDQVRELKAADKQLRRRHAEQIRELKATVDTYANQIQILALRNANLDADNQRLRAHLGTVDADVIPMRQPPAPPPTPHQRNRNP